MTKDEKAKPKRAPNAYMMFCKKTRPEITKENPDITFTETGKKLGSRQTSGTGSRRVSFACRFAGMAGSMKDASGGPSKLNMALKKWGFASKSAAASFCSKNKKKK